MADRGGRAFSDSNDDGFTLVEVVVTLTLIAVVMTGLAALMYSAMRSAATTNRRTQATALATREIESMRAITYSKLGFYENQFLPGSPPTAAVLLGCSSTTPPTCPAAPAGALPRTGAQQVGSTSFDISRTIEWGDTRTESGLLADAAYKRTRVQVTWTDDVGPHTVSEETVIYPGSCGAHATKSTCASANVVYSGVQPPQPVTVGATTPATGADYAVDVTWVPPVATTSVAGYMVEWSPDRLIWTPSRTQSATSTSLRVEPLASSTPYWFRVRSVSADGTASDATETATSLATSSATGPPGCEITGLYVSGATGRSPRKTYLTSATNVMAEDLNLHVVTDNECASSTVTVADDAGPSWTPNRYAGAYGQAAPTSGSAGWASGVHTFRVKVNGAPTTVTSTLLVCQYKPLSSRSLDPGQC